MAHTMVVDLCGVEFLASNGLRVLGAAHDVAEQSTQIALSDALGTVGARSLRVSGLDTLFTVYATTAQALTALAELDRAG